MKTGLKNHRVFTIVIILTNLFFAIGGQGQSYCAAGSNDASWEHISVVQVGSINNSSSTDPGGYSDYTSLSTDMNIGVGYPITVENGDAWNGDQVGIWVDWNQDMDFEDTGEFIATSGGPGTFTTTITPPLGSSTGTTRMRIRLKYTGALNPCGTDPWGEVEDYSINVLSSESITTGTISPTNFCSGTTVNVPFTISGNYTAGNVFTAQLSDGSGSFASPLSIGTLTSTASGTISCVIPSGISTGSAYRIRIVSSTPSVIGTDNGIDLTISTSPAITAMTETVLSGFSFVVTPIDGTNGIVPSGTTYSWPAPVVTGGITGGAASSGAPSNINGILTNPTSIAQTATYTVTPTSGTCTGNTFTLTITLDPSTNFYSYQTGSWNIPTTWTSDPSGTIQIGNSIPGDNDKVFILSGRTVSLPGNIVTQNLIITIEAGGFLNQGVYEFTNSLATLAGQGTLKLASDNFPSVGINTFISQGGGTTEYYNSANFVLPTTQTTYNNLSINTIGYTTTQLSNISLNGNLHVKSGTFRINDNSSSSKLTLIISGNVTVDENAFISVGNGVTNSTIGGSGGTAPFLAYYLNFHTVVINGNFTNNGTVEFTNLTYPIYNAFPPTIAGATSGAASVYFMGASDNTLDCNGITNFYNLIIDKGIDRTFKLTINSTDYENFKLFGANNLEVDGGVTNNPNLRKSLWVRTGTLVLQGSLVIPSLSEGTAGNADYYIPFNGALIVDGVDVILQSTADNYQEINVAYSVAAPNNSTIGITQNARSGIFVFGKMQVNNGFVTTRESRGIVTSDVASGQLIINGGTIDIKQFLSFTGSASYNQTGGLLLSRGRFQRTPVAYDTIINLTDVSLATLNTSRVKNGIRAGSGSFNLEQSSNIFAMSGGTIRIYDVCGINNNQQEAFDVKSSASHINVTGGTVEIRPVTGTNLADASNYRINTNAPLFDLVIDRVSSTSVVQLRTSPLTVLNDLNLASGDFSANNLDVTIGGDFSVAIGTSYTPGTNTTIFNGTENQTLSVNLADPLSVNMLTIDKPAGAVINLAGSQNTFNVNSDFRLVLGTLNDNGKTINIIRDAFNSGLHIGTGKIVFNGTLTQNIDGNGIFQNVELNNTNASATPVSLSDNMTINGDLIFSQDKLFYIGIYNLILGSSATIVNSNTIRYIQTAGNAGDGGVSKEFTTTGTFLYPIGAPTITPSGTVKYTPATIGLSSAPTSFGTITVNPVGYEHPGTTINGQSLTYFWRVKSSGFTGLAPNSVIHSFSYNQSNVVGNESNYIPAVYTNNDYTWSYGTNSNPPINTTTNVITDWTTPTNSADFLDGDYTAGDAAFGAPVIYYSRQTGVWGNLSTWSLTGHNTNNPPSVPPGLNDVVIIGGQDSVYLATQNTIPNTDVRSCASLQIEDGSAFDIGYNFNSNFGMVINHPNGNGNFRLTTSWTSESTYTFPQGDFTDFNVNLGTTELYSTNPTAGTTYWLPNGILSYGNLILSPLGGSNIIFANNDLTIYGNLITRGQNADSWFCPNWNVNYPTPPETPIAKTITIAGDMHIQGGALIWYQNGNIAQDFVIHGDVIVETLSALYVWSGATNQNMSIGGSLINNTDGLNHGLTTVSKVDFTDIPVTFFGPSDASISNTTGDPVTIFSSLTVNKGNSQATILTCDIEGSLSTPVNNWLTLLNGTYSYERVNPGTDFTISTNTAYSVPSTAGLNIDYTNANNTNVLIGNANNNDGDLLLSGKLTLINGNVYIGPIAAPANNNDIEYFGSGASSINVHGGTLTVNGQIRRNISTTNGILNYVQSGGNVTINGNNANTDYAKLEVLNEGSSFLMSGGIISIIRGGGTSYGDLFLRPESYSVQGGTIIFTNIIPNSIQNYSMDATFALNNLTITGTAGSGLNATLDLMVNPLELKGNLTLSNPRSIFNTNNLDVSIRGNMENNGTYNFGTNTTTFNGGVQVISGSSSTDFNNLNVASINSLTVNSSSSVSQDLTILSANLILGNNKITLSGNLVNNGSYSDDNTIGGLSFSGTTQQQISGTGGYGSLEISNIMGVRLNNGIILQNNLILTQGIFDINSKLLTLSQNSSIIGTPGLNKMILTEGVISSPGVRKFFSAVPQVFTFPVGIEGKYTPAEFTITSSAAVGYIHVSPINECHPSVTDLSNALSYYWKIESAGISGFNGNVVLQYIPDDVAGVESDYVAARLVLPGNNWSLSGTNNVDEINHQITFEYSGSNNLNGDYTAGDNNAFPAEASTYVTNNNGLWTDNAIWTPVGSSPPCPFGGPEGANVIINHSVSIDVNGITAVTTVINGTLRILSPTFGHSLGVVEGNGTMFLEGGNIPAGDYSSFLDCSGNGTLEYGGSGTYTIIASQFSTVPNLFFTGTGIRILPNKDLTICKRLVIDGPRLDNSINNRKLTIMGTMERYNSGFFTAGIGEAPASTVSFAGITKQTVGGSTGDFSGSSSFNNLEINNLEGLDIGTYGLVIIRNDLLLTNGTINTSNANRLFLNNASSSAVLPEGGSNASFVNGPLIKRIVNGGQFHFPLGKGTVKGHKITLTSTAGSTTYWNAEYFTPNPTAHSLASPLQATNTMEYWSVNSVKIGSTAKVKLGWDPSSDLPPLMTPNGLADIRVAEFSSGNWNVLSSDATGNDYYGDVTTTDFISISTTPQDFTIASVSQVIPRAKLTPEGPVCGESGIPISFAYFDPISLNYTLEYTVDGIPQPTVNVSSLPYILPTPNPGTYKLTNFTYDNGDNIGVVDTISVNVYAPPVDAYAGEDQSLCGVSGTVLEGNDPGAYSGIWTIIDGYGGILLNSSQYNTVFTGALGQTYTLRWTISNYTCISYDDVIISFPVTAEMPLPFTEVASPVCQSSTGNIYTVPNKEGVTYSWSYSGEGHTIIGTGNSVTIDFDELATSGTLSVTATNSCGTGPARTVNIIVLTELVWTGDVNTNWNTPENWSCGFIPKITSNVEIPDVPNKPVLSVGDIGVVESLLIEIGSSLTISGNNLQIFGTATNNGTFDATSGTIEMAGSSAQTIEANLFTTNTIENLIINNAAGVTLLGTLNVTGIVTATTGDLASGGYLSLLSSNVQTALINGSGNGQITGNVNMQRYLDSGFGYKYFSSPFQNATVNEFGDDMDLTASFPTFYKYDENVNSAGWVSYVNPADPLIPLNGYAINFGSDLLAKTVDVAGLVNNGPVSRTIYNNNKTYTQGFNLFGNPYPSPIDWDASSGWTKANIDNALYYFKAGNVDQYSGTYSTYINGISSDGQATNIIPSMQGFFVHVSDGAYPVTANLGMNNDVRVTDLTHSFLKSNENSNNILFRFTSSYSDNPISSDPMVVYLEENATPNFDKDFDALKLMNTNQEITNFYSLLPDGTKLSINALSESIDSMTTIPVGLLTYYDGDISFRISDFENLHTEMKVYFHDAATGINLNLIQEQEYKIYLEAGEYANRFSIKLVDGTSNLPDIDMSDFFNVYSSKGHLKANIGYLSGNDGVLYLFDIAGRKLFSMKVFENGLYEFDPRLSNGIYIATLVSGDVVKTQKIIIQK